MLVAVTDWETEDVAVDLLDRVQVLTVSGDYRSVDPDALCRSLAHYVGVSRSDVATSPDRLAITAPMGFFVEPVDYRAWVDEAVAEAERDTVVIMEWMQQMSRIAAVTIAILSADAGLSTDAIMRAALVSPKTADAIMAGKSLPAADLVRIATALGTSIDTLLAPIHGRPEDLAY